ncbi:hypothetical protein EVAR_45250_1 [Eumeta japonica]|uniref:Uncharacterized protein n=1 Tax=Eumeta variegata TaxID=151549 RepID=A0A4C1XBG1_EUMVA|nr:hypothetical protein EVAR_45250_1 [Eumeta japonica]
MTPEISRVGCVQPLSLFDSNASADGVEERSLARSAQAERDSESCFFVPAAAGAASSLREHAANLILRAGDAETFD